MKTNERRGYNGPCNYSILCREDKEQMDRIEKHFRNYMLDAVKVAIQKLDIDENFSGQKINGYLCCKSDALKTIEELKDE